MPFIEQRSLDVVDAHLGQLEAVLNFAKIFPCENENLKTLFFSFEMDKIAGYL